MAAAEARWWWLWADRQAGGGSPMPLKAIKKLRSRNFAAVERVPMVIFMAVGSRRRLLSFAAVFWLWNPLYDLLWT